MEKLGEKEIGYQLSKINKEWSLKNQSIKRDFKFKNFIQAFSFMMAVALLVEKANHHPDWSNVYNKVTIELNTHEADGLTMKDFDLAKQIDLVHESFV